MFSEEENIFDESNPEDTAEIVLKAKSSGSNSGSDENSREESTVEIDDEDLIETLEVNLQNTGLLSEDEADIEKKIKSLEISVKQLVDKISDLTEDQEEAFRRISLSVGDSGIALKSSEETAKEVRDLKKELSVFVDSVRRDVNLDLETVGGNPHFEEYLKEFTEKLEELQHNSNSVEQSYRETTDSIDKIFQQLENSRDQIEQMSLRLENMGTEKIESLSENMEYVHEKLSGLEEKILEKMETSEDRYEDVRNFVTRSIESIEEKYETLKATFEEKVNSLRENIKFDVEQQVSRNDESIHDMVSANIAHLDSRISNHQEILDEIKEQIIRTKESLEKGMDINKPEVDRHFENIEENLAAINENFHLEMEAFSEEVKEQLLKVDKVEEKIGKIEESYKATETQIENMTAKIAELTSQMGEKSDERLKTLEEKILTLRTEIEEGTSKKILENLEEKIEPIRRQIVNLDNDIAEKLSPIQEVVSNLMDDKEGALSPIRREVAEAKRYLEEEMMKVKDSWTKLDKTISDSEGAMEIAQRAKESLERMEKEVSEAINRVEGMINSINETTLKSDSNKEKIDLTIKLIDEARERIKAVQAAPTGPSGLPQASETAALEAVNESIHLTPREILEPPTADDMDFDLDDLLHVMIKHGASDLHIKAGVPPIVRLDGELVPVGSEILSEEDCKKLVLPAMNAPMRKHLAKKQEVDFAYTTSEARFRVNAFLQKQSVSAAFRLLWTEIPTFDKLHLPEVLKSFCEHQHGLVLITGPAGNGKSTTLSAMVDHINENKKLHIVTIEDPIEFIHKDKQSIITQREVGTDTDSFHSGLKFSLRQDPNVILIGEMRDPETIMTAVIAAETGHLVFSTLHTPNTSQAVNRIIDVFSGDMQKQFRLLLSNTLRGVVSQRLLTRADEPGRIPAVEVLVVTPTIASLIMEGHTNDIYEYLTQGGIDGMQTFTQSLISLYEQGFITKEEAMLHADQPTELRMALEGHITGGTASVTDDTLMSWL